MVFHNTDTATNSVTIIIQTLLKLFCIFCFFFWCLHECKHLDNTVSLQTHILYIEARIVAVEMYILVMSITIRYHVNTLQKCAMEQFSNSLILIVYLNFVIIVGSA